MWRKDKNHVKWSVWNSLGKSEKIRSAPRKWFLGGLHHGCSVPGPIAQPVAKAPAGHKMLGSATLAVCSGFGRSGVMGAAWLPSCPRFTAYGSKDALRRFQVGAKASIVEAAVRTGTYGGLLLLRSLHPAGRRSRIAVWPKFWRADRLFWLSAVKRLNGPEAQRSAVAM